MPSQSTLCASSMRPYSRTQPRHRSPRRVRRPAGFSRRRSACPGRPRAAASETRISARCPRRPRGSPARCPPPPTRRVCASGRTRSKRPARGTPPARSCPYEARDGALRVLVDKRIAPPVEPVESRRPIFDGQRLGRAVEFERRFSPVPADTPRSRRARPATTEAAF